MVQGPTNFNFVRLLFILIYLLPGLAVGPAQSREIKSAVNSKYPVAHGSYTQPDKDHVHGGRRQGEKTKGSHW